MSICWTVFLLESQLAARQSRADVKTEIMFEKKKQAYTVLIRENMEMLLDRFTFRLLPFAPFPLFLRS